MRQHVRDNGEWSELGMSGFAKDIERVVSYLQSGGRPRVRNAAEGGIRADRTPGWRIFNTAQNKEQ